MFITKNDANVSTKLSINLIKNYQHKIYRLSVSNDKSDLLYAKCIDPKTVEKIVNFLYSFDYNKFKTLTETEKEDIFNELMDLYKNLIIDSDNLRLKYIY